MLNFTRKQLHHKCWSLIDRQKTVALQWTKFPTPLYKERRTNSNYQLAKLWIHHRHNGKKPQNLFQNCVGNSSSVWESTCATHARASCVTNTGLHTTGDCLTCPEKCFNRRSTLWGKSEDCPDLFFPIRFFCVCFLFRTFNILIFYFLNCCHCPE